MSSTDEGRFVKLETVQENHSQGITDLRSHIISIDNNVSEILQKLAAHQGFLRGVIFTVGVLASLIGAAIGVMAEKIFGHS